MFIMLGALLAGTSLLPSTRAATLYVGGAGPGNYTTIQDAIDAASPGDTVHVYGGTYFENPVVTKSLTLEGETAESTIIDGRRKGDVLTVGGSYVAVRGFTVQNSSIYPIASGIALSGQKHSISGNIIRNNHIGVLFWSSAQYNRVYENVISGITAIQFWHSKSNQVFNNRIQGSTGVELGGDSRYNSITHNEFSAIDEAIYIGRPWAVQKPYSNSIAYNVISDAPVGVAMIESEGNYVHSNILRNNDWGVFVGTRESSLNSIYQNLFEANGCGVGGYDTNNSHVFENIFISNNYGVLLQSSDNFVIHHNNFISNDLQAFDDGSSNQWDIGYPRGGNYWSDYNGTDNYSGPNQDQPGSDGIGDSPRDIPGDSNSDRYPLMDSVPLTPQLPSAPRNLIAASRPWSVTLRWDPPYYDGFSTITNYSVYRGTSIGGEVFLREVGNVLNYTDTEVDIGRTYYYRVSAKNAAGEGARSNEVMVTVPASWRPPLDLVQVPGIENITVNWTPHGGGGGSRICSSTGHGDCVREAGNVSSRRSKTFRSGGVR